MISHNLLKYQPSGRASISNILISGTRTHGGTAHPCSKLLAIGIASGHRVRHNGGEFETKLTIGVLYGSTGTDWVFHSRCACKFRRIEDLCDSFAFKKCESYRRAALRALPQDPAQPENPYYQPPGASQCHFAKHREQWVRLERLFTDFHGGVFSFRVRWVTGEW